MQPLNIRGRKLRNQEAESIKRVLLVRVDPLNEPSVVVISRFRIFNGIAFIWIPKDGWLCQGQCHGRS
jgi:hypothetical protein